MSSAHLGDSWESLRKKIFTSEEIAACDLKVAVINEIIKSREDDGLLRQQLAKFRKL